MIDSRSGRERPVAGTLRGYLAGPPAVLAGLVSTLYVALRVWWASVPSLHPDEAFTLLAVRQPWGDLLRTVVQDVVHPPLFYVQQKAWLLLVGENIFLLRLLPVLIAALTIVPLYLLCRELRLSPTAANLAVFFVAVNPFLARFSQTLRMYSALLLLGTCSLWLLLRYCREEGRARKTLVALTCVNLLMVYTQYLGAILILVEIVVVFLDARPKIGAFLAANVFIGIAFLPWALLVMQGSRQRSGIGEDVEGLLGWTGRPDWRDLVTYFARLTGPYRSGLAFSKGKSVIGLLLVAVPVGLAFRTAFAAPGDAGRRSRWTTSPLSWLAIFALAPVAIAFAVSLALPISILSPRYLTLAVIPYLLLWTVALDALEPKALRRVVIAAAMVWAALGFREESRLGERTDWIRLAEDMRGAESRGHGTSEPLARVYTLVSAKPIRYVLERAGDRRFEIVTKPKTAEMEGPRFWLAYQESYWKPAITRAMLDELAGKGYRVEKSFQSGAEDHRVHVDLFVLSPAPAAEAPGSSPP